jgi:hypothetical protein
MILKTFLASFIVNLQSLPRPLNAQVLPSAANYTQILATAFQ